MDLPPVAHPAILAAENGKIKGNTGLRQTTPGLFSGKILLNHSDN
jgi:hypothetical protein